MGFRQFLKVVRAAEERVMIELLIPNLHLMQDDLDLPPPTKSLTVM